jgi:hypothetical protein
MTFDLTMLEEIAAEIVYSLSLCNPSSPIGGSKLSYSTNMTQSLLSFCLDNQLFFHLTPIHTLKQ